MVLGLNNEEHLATFANTGNFNNFDTVSLNQDIPDVLAEETPVKIFDGDNRGNHMTSN